MNRANGHSVTGAVLALVLLFAGVGCEQEGDAERAGERIDEAMEDTGDAMKDAAEKAGDKLERATD